MKFNDLKGMAVVSVTDAHKLGTVENLIVDVSAQRILGLLVKVGGLFSSDQAVLLGEIKSVGEDAVTIQDASKLNSQDKFGELKGQRTLDAVLKAKVMSESGTNMGAVADVGVDLQEGAITDYILDGKMLDRLRGNEHFIAAANVKSIGQDMVVVADEAAIG